MYLGAIQYLTSAGAYFPSSFAKAVDSVGFMSTYEAKQENSLSQGMIGLVGSHTGLSIQ